MKTKKQRLAIYKKMLKWLESDYYGCSNPCFCAALYWVTKSFNPDDLNTYPELMEYKPKHIRSSYWFNTNKKGISIRKQILRKIIKKINND